METKQSSMNKEFVPYEQALALKELGFSSPYTIGGYQGGAVFYYEKGNLYYDGRPMYSSDAHEGQIYAPLFQQAFRWFREKYELHSYIYSDYSWNISGGIWDLNGYKDLRYDLDSEPYTTFEEAESACIEKLIEIVKNYNETQGDKDEQ